MALVLGGQGAAGLGAWAMQQLLLRLLVDSLWPPRASKDNYVKGQVGF